MHALFISITSPTIYKVTTILLTSLYGTIPSLRHLSPSLCGCKWGIENLLISPPRHQQLRGVLCKWSSFDLSHTLALHAHRSFLIEQNYVIIQTHGMHYIYSLFLVIGMTVVAFEMVLHIPSSG